MQSRDNICGVGTIYIRSRDKICVVGTISIVGTPVEFVARDDQAVALCVCVWVWV